MRHLPTALAAALLLLSGSARVIAAGGMDHLAVALLAAGLIAFGAWLKDHDD